MKALLHKALLFVPVVLSLVVLAAHFMRYGNSIFTIGTLGLVALLFLRKPWVARLVQVALVLGALEWLRTLMSLVQMRAALDEPYTRMAIILAVVVVITLASALLFQTKTLGSIYQLKPWSRHPHED